MTAKYVLYLRVSTSAQGTSGLGLDAQRAAATAFLSAGNWIVLGEFVDVESGGRDDRPELAKAMNLCEMTGAKLLIAKLDRLSRDVHFLSGLMKSGVEFTACDMPQADKFTVHILAALAERERELISARTKAGLGVIKARIAAEGFHVSRAGRVITRLGNPTPGTAPDPERARAAHTAKANAYAARVGPIVRGMREGGKSLNAIAEGLNGMGYRSPRGSIWTPMTVKRVLARATS